MALLEIDDLCIEFDTGTGPVRVVEGLSLAVEEGQTVCLVGESGCGKSVTALAVTRLLESPPARYPRGRIRIGGISVLDLPERELPRIRGRRVGYVFQEPGASLNPVQRVGAQIREALVLHRPGAARKGEVLNLLRQVGIADPEVRYRLYPHELSGGMQQRVMLAMALAARPKLLVADEPTTALDVTIQAQILELLRELKSSCGMGLLLITHNLGLVGEIADQVAVMYAGQIVERGDAAAVLRRPRHPYTRALLDSMPVLGEARERLTAIPGVVPAPEQMPRGCRFHPRCPQARPECHELTPALEEAGPGRHVRCPYWRETP